MFCKSYSREGTHENGKQLVAAEIIVKTTPAQLPTTTDDIANIQSGWMLGPGSTILSTNPFEIHIMNDLFTWDKLEKSSS